MNLNPIKIAAGLGLGLIVSGTILYWYDPVLFPGFSTFGMPLFHSALDAPPKIYPGFSYGIGIVLCLVLAWIGWEMRRPVPIAWVALVLLLLGLNCPLQIGFSQPSWLDRFLQARADNLALSAFGNNTDFPIVILAQPIPSAKLTDVQGLYDRWYASIVTMQIGWWFYMSGALLFTATALLSLPDATVRRTFLIRAVVVIFLFLSFHCLTPVLGELCWNVGQQEERAGDRHQAERYYRDALALDEWNRRIPRVYARLGAVAEADHRVHAPEYHFFMGQRQMSQSDFDEALEEFSQSMTTTDPDLHRVASNSYSQVAFTVAMHLYRHGNTLGKIPVKIDMVPPEAGMAALYWQKAAQATESNLAENFMAARAFQDSAQYNRASALLKLAMEKTSDPMLMAHLFDSQGDVDYLRGDLSQARLNYLKAYSSLNHNKDYWSIRTVKDLTDNVVHP
jgi:hypothetical protein